MQYTGANLEKVEQNIPLCYSCYKSGIMLIVNERARAPYLPMIGIH